MEKFNLLVDSSFNLLKASEKNQENIQNMIQNIDNKSKFLENTYRNIEDKVSNAVEKTSREAAEYISHKVLSDLDEAKEAANIASQRFEKAARFSILKIGSMFFLFFLMAGALLWLLFIKEIPTIEEIHQLRMAKAALENEVSRLKEYGNVATCNGKPCIQVNPDTKYGDKLVPYFIIVPKK